ncbi:DUF4394 domain-containing protein [Amycolatopsis sp. 195334CR]|uniref:DUF4394 domain-containing protein n=1 Tax=Amycolatopsis sp. 195334CR TaxID=2814588 RepID=UPI001A903D25|nr:DUF4394 domain-containing protein [Amycolatopsis sp. 195334CR]MBN6038509.1 DUF4394 domain-containing protein [Amycolatopsis sp. 195334CR]
MRKTTAAVAAVAAILATGFGTATASATGSGTTGPGLLVLGESGLLTRHDAKNPLLIKHKVQVKGLAKHDRLIGIDVRPANGVVYALGASGQLYTVDARSGKATGIGTPVPLAGKAAGFDFNPTVDRIRLVTDTGQNLRLHPDTGAVAATDGALAYAPGDRHAGARPQVAASGYTNSVAGATTTALYGVDSAKDTLVLQGTAPGVTPPVSPNTGQLFTVGRLGVNVTSVNGFDIGAGNQAVAAVRLGGLVPALVRIDLGSGHAKVVSPLLTKPVGVAFLG